MVPTESLITWNIYVRYQRSSTHFSKVISKVTVSERRTESQNDRQDKNNMPPIDLRSRGHKNICSTIQMNLYKRLAFGYALLWMLCFYYKSHSEMCICSFMKLNVKVLKIDIVIS